MLHHIQDEISFITKSTSNRSKSDFLEDEVLKRAVVRSIEIIGEAVKKLPTDFKNKHMDIDWRAIAGTRDRLIHGYFGIDYEIIWDIVEKEIPHLKNFLEKTL